jgi:hypothetical protein
MQCVYFCIYDRPRCVWDDDVPAKNSLVIDSIDPEYFRYQARIHAAQLSGDDKHIAALALRSAYFHGLESLFAILGATLQAQNCIYAWLLEYRLEEVRAVVRCINRREPIRGWLLKERPSWESVSRAIFPIHAATGDPTADRLTIAFRRLAGDFLSADCQAEYNSTKHGLRCRSGGFQFRFNIPDEHGKPREHAMAGSEFGASFLQLKRIKPHRHHVYASLHSFNWNPAQMSGRLLLVSNLIRNLLVALRAMNSDGQAHFEFPSEAADWDDPWSGVPGIRSMKMDDGFSARGIIPISEADILAEIPLCTAATDEHQ